MNNCKLKPQIIAITEIKPKNVKGDIFLSEFNLEGYQCFCSGLEDSKSRGILIYVEKSLRVSVLEIPINFKENLFIMLKGENNQNIIFGNLYRSPSSIASNDDNLLNLFKFVANKWNFPTIMVGDFNYGNINWNQKTAPSSVLNLNERNFYNSLRENFYMQHVNAPTRQRGNDIPHILDLIITNDKFISDIDYLSPLGKSDHNVLVFNCLLNTQSEYKPFKLKYDKGEYNRFCKFLHRDWNIELRPEANDIDAMWNCFSSLVKEGTVKFIPKTKNNPQNNFKKNLFPYNKEINTLIHRKHRLWNRWIESKDEETRVKYVNIRNKVKNETRKINMQNQENIARKCKTEPKRFWQYVKNKSKSKSEIGDLKILDENGNVKILDSDVDKADALNSFFTSVFTTEQNENFENLDLNIKNNRMEELLIDENDVKIKLNKLKIDKSPGPDTLHPRILYEVRDEIAYPLSIIFNESLQKSKLPEEWKTADVIALHKKGSKIEMGNYRPVSLTSVPCKIMESLIRDHIMSYLLKNKLLSNKQYGFVRGRSTMLKILHMLDKWTNYLENGGQIDAIYTDFEKAFDKVPHKRLISKLKAYKIDSNIIAWIKDFLQGRKHRVRIKSRYSKWGKVSSGIPQGSVLGPLLFLIYINDLPDLCEKKSEIYLFADDSKLYKYIIDDNDCRDLQACIDTLQKWTDMWLLKLNSKKCKVISFGRQNLVNHTYSICEGNKIISLERVNDISDLGVILDDKLSFNSHIQQKINKAYSMLGILKRNFKNMSIITFVMLYKSIVRSQLEYCNSVWSPYKKSDIEDIEKVQKRATKLISSIKNLNYANRLQKCNLTTLRFRRIRGDMIETFKILNGKYDINATPRLKLCTTSNTRGNDFKLENVRHTYELRKHFFTNRITNIWNSLPNSVVKVDSTNQFKNKLDEFWKSQEMIFDYKAELTGIGNRS